MFLERWVQTLEQRVAAMGRRLWRSDPRMQLREEVQQVSHDLRDQRLALNGIQIEIDALRKRINANQAAVARLTAQIGARRWPTRRRTTPGATRSTSSGRTRN